MLSIRKYYINLLVNSKLTFFNFFEIQKISVKIPFQYLFYRVALSKHYYGFYKARTEKYLKTKIYFFLLYFYMLKKKEWILTSWGKTPENNYLQANIEANIPDEEKINIDYSVFDKTLKGVVQSKKKMSDLFTFFLFNKKSLSNNILRYILLTKMPKKINKKSIYIYQLEMFFLNLKSIKKYFKKHKKAFYRKYLKFIFEIIVTSSFHNLRLYTTINLLFLKILAIL